MQNFNSKLKKFGFLETLKIHIHYTEYLTYKDPTSSYFKLMFLILYTLQFQI